METGPDRNLLRLLLLRLRVARPALCVTACSAGVEVSFPVLGSRRGADVRDAASLRLAAALGAASLCVIPH